MTVLNFTLKTDDAKGNQYLEDTTLTGKKISGKTITLGSTLKVDGVSTKIENAEINIINDIDNQVRYDKKGNDIVITVFKKDGNSITDSVLGKITLKNIGTKKFVEAYDHGEGSYKASLTCATKASKVNDFFALKYSMQYKNIDKAVSLKGTYLDEYFLGGNGNDTIKGVGGTNTITGGEGFDKMYSGEGDDKFEVSQGDAKLNRKEYKDGSLKDFTGAGDIIYNSNEKDTLILSNYDSAKISYSKDKKNNLIIEALYDESGKVQKDKITVTKYFASDAEHRINIVGEEPTTLNIVGSGKIEGTNYNDTIAGSKGVDKITTGGGYDVITAGKANDDIAITGTGTKTVKLEGGDGNDTIALEEGIDSADVTLKLRMSVADDENNNVIFDYIKNHQDLVISAINVIDGSSESVTLRNYFGVDIPIKNADNDPIINPVDGDFKINNVYLNGTIVKNRIIDDNATITVGGVKVSTLLNELTVGQGENEKTVAEWLKNNKIKVPGALTGANVFLGTDYNNAFYGTTGKDVMVSQSNGINEFYTGNGGQTGIASLNDGSDDTYNIAAFNKTATGIYDIDGQYNNLQINGADVNNLHMIKTNLDFLSSYNVDKILGYDVNNIQTLTTTDCIKKISGLDLEGIGEALKDIKENNSDKVEAINALLGITPSVLSKMQGVSVVSGADFEGFQDIELPDKNQTISAISQEVIHQKTSEALTNFMTSLHDEYGLVVNDKAALANVLFRVSKQAQAESLSDSDYKAIKTSFFNMLNNLYVGTSGDNAYTIKQADNFAVASGTGADSFTFSGDLATEDGAKYSIIAANDGNDTITFKSLEIGNELNYEGLITTSTEVTGAKFTEQKNGKSASIDYVVGEDGTGFDLSGGNEFKLTVKDKKRSYDVSAQNFGTDPTEIDWSASKVNHIATYYSKDLQIDSSSGYNKLTIDTSLEDINTLTSFKYKYNGGHDIVTSEGYASADEYSADLTSKTNLKIADNGTDGHDTLNITAKTNDFKLFFDVTKEGTVNGNYSFVYTSALKKSDINIDSDSDTLFTNNGIEVNLNTNLDANNEVITGQGVDEVTYTYNNETENVDFAAINALKGQIASWLKDNGYSSVFQVFAEPKDNSDITTLLNNYYNDANLLQQA